MDNAVVDWSPAETIHVAVIDPGVGTDRAIVYARIGEQIFIAPDNGLLSRLAIRCKYIGTNVDELASQGEGCKRRGVRCDKKIAACVACPSGG